MSEFPRDTSRWGPPGESGAVILRRCIETEADSLRGTLAVYLHRAWAMSHEEARDRANDVLAEVVTIALRKAADFDPRRSPHAWLLGIGTRVVLQHRAALFTQRQRETGPTAGAHGGSSSEEHFFERLIALSSPDVASTVEQEESVEVLLAPLSPDARHVVRLAIIAGLRGESLAQVLHCSPGAARVRSFRALRKLKAAWDTPAGGNAEGSQA